MKTLLRIEELFLFGLSILLFSFLDFPWWLFAVLLFVPDLSMVGYVANTRIGARIYNLFHLKATAIGLYIIGSIISVPVVQLIGIILLAHTSLDRVFDFGLKYPDLFQHTHLSPVESGSATSH